jgi:predicted GNAT family acetyltransferase
MPVMKAAETHASIGELMDRAREEPLIIETGGAQNFVLLPIDDELLDLLIERSPRLIEKCRQIRQRMDQGEYWTHEQVIEMFQNEAG